MDVHANGITVIDETQPINRTTTPALFFDSRGKKVLHGDRVEFYVEGEGLPTNGVVQTYNGLQIACFSMLTNQWEYHTVIL